MQDLELLQSFYSEGLDMLDEVEPKLVEIQHVAENQGAFNPEQINAVFRLFHSLKGSAGFLQLNHIAAVTHEAETLLDLFRKGKALITAQHTQLLCRTCDCLRHLLGRVETTHSDHDGAAEAKTMSSELAATIARETAGRPAPAAVKPPPPAPTPPPAAPPLTAGADMVHLFVQEAAEVLEVAEQGLIRIEQQPDQTSETIADILRAIHTFKGNCGLLALADLERISHKMETVLQGIRDGTVPSAGPHLRLLLRLLDVFRGGVAALSHGQSPTIAGCPGMLDLLDEMLPHGGIAGEMTRAPEPEPAPPPPPAAQPATLEPKPAPTPPPAAPEAAGMSAEAAERGAARLDAAAAPAAAIARRDIRVNVDKLDLLTNLIGELVIAEAMVTHNSDLQGLHLENFDRSAHQLNRITNDLQDIAMSLRMVPIEATFRKMIRLVHDLSAKAGKRIELKLLGEDTEVDRTVAELISDPLVHMVRNSIDHGIETPAERVRSGKPESGTLTIEARYQAGEVWIIVSDNGRGLNRDKILAKGLERGLVPPGAALRDEEIYNLIFLPGFSTADRITDVSGRGVGMDVVKRNIERIRGRVEIQTTPGQGTRFTIRIPLTLAIISGMLVRVGAERYIIPLLCIRESLHPTADMLHTVTGRGEMIMMRGELLPLFRLAQLFSTAGAIGDAAQGIVVVVQDGPLRVGLLVDELLGQQQTVIKSLGDMFGDIKGVSGASIMSDGRIGLILDIEGIVKLAHGV